MKNINLKIYQMKHDETTRGKKFWDIDEDVKYVDLNDYYLMYEMMIEKDITLNDIYCMFNDTEIKDYKGHSLSVSDIIVLDGKAYYVQGMGFKKIDLCGVAENRIALGFPR